MRFLFVDHITALVPSVSVRGVKHVSHQDPYLCLDATGRWCFMPSLIGEALGQLAAWNVMSSGDFKQRPVAGLASLACLYRSAYVGETILLESHIDSLDASAVQYHSVARVADEVIFTIDGALGPLLPLEEFSDPLEVREQFRAIYRPDEPVLLVSKGGEVSTAARVPSMEFDSILECEGHMRLCAEKRILPDAPYFPDHFPRKPVLPMTVLLECILNLAGTWVASRGTYAVRTLRNIKMSDFIKPNDLVRCTLTVKHDHQDELVLRCRCEVEGRRVCVLELQFYPQG